MKEGKITPIAVVKSGKTLSYEDFVKAAAPAPAPAPAAAPAAPAPAPAAEPAKDAKK